MISYVLGFVFDWGYHHVLLIEKKTPAWQAGRLNGLGGKIAGTEKPPEAMRRELCEETRGALGGEVELKPFGRLRGEDYEVWLFWGRVAGVGENRLLREHCENSTTNSCEFADRALPTLPSRLAGIETPEGTTLVALVSDLSHWPVLPNLRYLVPMAMNHARGLDSARFFEIAETEVPAEVGS